MSGNTGLLTARCDPYGAESTISLLGGMYPENQVGRIMWHCEQAARARYRLVCSGGVYGGRLAADGGIVPAYVCEGGHRGVVMPLCDDHRKSIARRQSDLCPRCVFPPEVRGLAEALQLRQADMHNAFSLGFLAAAAKLGAAVEDLQAQMNDYSLRGIVHKCPLRMMEVS